LKLKRERKQFGSVVLDKRRNVWMFLWRENGTRRSKAIGTLQEFRSKSATRAAAKPLRNALEAGQKAPKDNSEILVKNLIEKYRAEKMPERFSTRRGYNAYLNNHVLPRWGECAITELQARPVELWIESLTLAPKSKVHIRGLIHTLWDYAMWRGDVPTQRNVMELVTIKGASKRTRQPRSLTVEEFQQFVSHLQEPFRTIALVCVCFGLRISECLALKWSDVNWLECKLLVERGIVRQNVDATKTKGSRKTMAIDRELLAVLQIWKQTTEFSAPGDWMFASPVQLGRLPWSYPYILRMFNRAGTDAGIGKVSPHVLRHSFRSWLDAVGTSIAVQQKMMRHSSVVTTLDIYGDVVTDEMSVAGGKVAGLALNGLQNGLQSP
jgi:integrase